MIPDDCWFKAKTIDINKTFFYFLSGTIVLIPCSAFQVFLSSHLLPYNKEYS